jgi:type IV pilus assembly protein PilA
MFIALRKRLERKEQGFTLIELMVVVLIIAILIAIAIPTFLGARRRAQDKQAQSNLRNGLTAEETFYTDNQEYTDVASPDLSDIESSLDFGTSDAGVRGVLPSVDAGGASQWVVLTSISKSGTTFCLQKISTGADAGVYYASDPAGGACPAGGAVAGWDKDVNVGW